MTSHLPASILRRRSGRYKPRAWIYLSESEPPTPPSLDYFEHDLRRTKRRGKKSVRRSHVGELRALRFVPLDVLFEVCHWRASAKSLPLIARSSDFLPSPSSRPDTPRTHIEETRAILMSRSSIFVWKSALANVEGLPFCPSDLTEPQYINLAFDEHCHFCLAPNVQQVFWACRVRCCKKCTGKYFISEH
ncbi:hypothetical protein FPV67DRAFT_902906 [Lyophyllum atratum]|nr:hypothetical protein FPV67DRAFT_902906 [Lyophyllum atratum]